MTRSVSARIVLGLILIGLSGSGCAGFWTGRDGKHASPDGRLERATRWVSWTFEGNLDGLSRSARYVGEQAREDAAATTTHLSGAPAGVSEEFRKASNRLQRSASQVGATARRDAKNLGHRVRRFFALLW